MKLCKGWAALALLAGTLLLSGCATQSLRNESIMPLAGGILEKVRPFALIGIDAAVSAGEEGATAEARESVSRAIDDMTAALKAGDAEAARRVSWSLIEEWAMRGIDELVKSGEASPGVAKMLRQRVENLRELLEQMQLTVRVNWTGRRSTLSGLESIGGRPVLLSMNASRAVDCAR